MKKIVLMMIVALMMGTMVTNAQPQHRQHRDPQRMVQQRVERLDKALGLTDEQKAEITKVYTQEMEAMSKDVPAQMSNGEKFSEEAMKAKREKMSAQRQATNAKIESLLTPEQAAKFAQFRDQQGKRGHDKQHDRRSDAKHGPKKGLAQDGNCCCCDKKVEK